MTKLFLILFIFVSWGVVGCGRPPKDHPSSEMPAAEQMGQVQVKNQTMATSAANKDVSFLQGIQYLKEANPKAAIQSFDEAIRLDPMDPAGYVILGQTYMRMKDYNRAIDSFSAASRVAPKEGEIYYFLALNQALIGDTEQAKENAQKSLEIFRQQQDEDRFLRSLALLRDLMQTEGRQ
jgi:tetratricopeptide (TPR) repeat protein